MKRLTDNILKLCLIILPLCFSMQTMAQKSAKYWIEFTDKNDSPYSIGKPERFLSQRSIERRKQYGIAITEEDLPVNRNYIDSILKTDKSNILLTKSKWLNGITIYSEDTLLEEKIGQISFVRFAEKTILIDSAEVFKVDTNRKFTDIKFLETYNKTPQSTEYQYGRSKGQIELNNMQWLHRLGYTGKGMIMMIMDAGFHNVDTIEPFKRLRDEGRLLGVKNFVMPEENLFRGGSHGTMVLSCIAAQIDGEIIGSAPDVAVYLAKTEDGRSEHKVEEDNWVAGIEWADSLGVDVLNSSLGYTKFDDSLVHSRKYSDLNGKVSRASRAATMAAKRGMIICNSAGNEGSKSWHYIGAPADANDILTVGGTYLNGQKADFSSFGPTADGRVKPDACAVGAYTQVSNTKGYTTIASGTSFSSPLLSGMVAALWQAFPEKTNYEIMDAVRRAGSQYDTPDAALGYGITDFMKAYNILYSKKNDDVTILNYVACKANKYKIFIDINSKKSQVVELKFKSRRDNYEVVKTKKIGAKPRDIEIQFDKHQEDWDIMDLQVTANGKTTSYVIGIEKAE